MLLEVLHLLWSDPAIERLNRCHLPLRYILVGSDLKTHGHNKLLELEKAVGEDQESYWERKFEHCSSCAQYREAAEEYGRQLRELSEDSKLEWAETHVWKV